MKWLAFSKTNSPPALQKLQPSKAASSSIQFFWVLFILSLIILICSTGGSGRQVRPEVSSPTRAFWDSGPAVSRLAYWPMEPWMVDGCTVLGSQICSKNFQDSKSLVDSFVASRAKVWDFLIEQNSVFCGRIRANKSEAVWCAVASGIQGSLFTVPGRESDDSLFDHKVILWLLWPWMFNYFVFFSFFSCFDDFRCNYCNYLAVVLFLWWCFLGSVWCPTCKTVRDPSKWVFPVNDV